MRGLLSPLLDLLYPPRCAACNTRGGWLCESCLNACTTHGTDACLRCGSRTSGRTCYTCARYIRHLDELHAAYVYGGPARDLVHRFKYDGLSAAADWMAGQMPVAWLPPDISLVPVPLHPTRERERGYNQSELLARALGKRTGHSVVPALKRVRYTAPQAHQDAASRWTNIKGAFAPAKSIVPSDEVLLVDDVCTTGATLEECASVLVEMGVKRVIALVFTRA